MSENMDSGLAALREVVRVRARRGHLGWLAKELNVGLSALEEFGTGKGNLPPDALSAIARVLLGDNVVYDAARDKLRRAGPEPRSLGITPPSHVPPPDQPPMHVGAPPPQPGYGLAKPKPQPRAGWE